MHTSNKIKIFSEWGKLLKNFNQTQQGKRAIEKASHKNPWFTPENSQLAIQAIANKMLNETILTYWTQNYTLPAKNPGTIGMVMAGNIPLAGFHDLLCCLMTGHKAMIKLSSKDDVLLPKLLDELYAIEPAFEKQIELTEKLSGFDAVIATGSNNSARYFEYYFGKYPHIIRKNRNSVAILTGKESKEDLQGLGRDVFSYFGLGCRNVSKLMVPENYDFDKLFKAFEEWQEVFHHNKYKNNYDYHKSLLLLNQEEHLDSGFLMLQEKPGELSSPMATLYYEKYRDENDALNTLQQQRENIQCVVTDKSRDSLPVTAFGNTQYPHLWEYADDVDTMKFLLKL